jgi:glutamine amidotransferase
MIGIVDCGLGNLASIANMLWRAGYEASISSEPQALLSARKLILPGVGAFDTAMRNLRERGLAEFLEQRVLRDGVPLLAICLGMQLLSRRSEEGLLPGLGWIDAETVRFQSDERHPLRIPHLGWNEIVPAQSHPILDGLPPEPRFYFVHSYHVRCNDPKNVLATATYGAEFCAAVCRDHIVGTQFHPEKSHRFGLQLLSNFAADP